MYSKPILKIDTNLPARISNVHPPAAVLSTGVHNSEGPEMQCTPTAPHRLFTRSGFDSQAGGAGTSWGQSVRWPCQHVLASQNSQCAGRHSHTCSCRSGAGQSSGEVLLKETGAGQEDRSQGHTPADRPGHDHGRRCSQPSQMQPSQRSLGYSWGLQNQKCYPGCWSS